MELSDSFNDFMPIAVVAVVVVVVMLLSSLMFLALAFGLVLR